MYNIVCVWGGAVSSLPPPTAHFTLPLLSNNPLTLTYPPTSHLQPSLPQTKPKQTEQKIFLRHDKRVLYCRSEEERDSWVHALQREAHVVPIADEYVFGRELGRGRFSVVQECVHKVGEFMGIYIWYIYTCMCVYVCVYMCVYVSIYLILQHPSADNKHYQRTPYLPP